MRWRIVIKAKTENAEGGLSDDRYWVWANDYDPSNVPFIPRVGEHLSFTIDKSPETYLEVVDVVTKYTNYDQCSVHIICDRVKKNE